MKNILGDMEVDKSGFMDMFAAALEGLAIGIIPPTNDQVIIGDMERKMCIRDRTTPTL